MEDKSSYYVVFLDIYLIWFIYLNAFRLSCSLAAFAHKLCAQFSQLCLLVSGNFPV